MARPRQRHLPALAFLLCAAAYPTLAAEERPDVLHVRVDSIIHGVAREFILESVEVADEDGADAFVLELATPGGDLDSTRRIVSGLLEAETPVVIFVSPQGSQAASAGFFILMAADLAAMAPGTNTGAAHPVGASGEDIEGVMGEKVEQDSAATIRSLASRAGRNTDLAEAAVMESRSFTADEALEAGLIELVADDLEALLEEIDGREVPVDSDTTVTLRTAGARVRTLEMSGLQRFLSTLAHPNIAYILGMLGVLGLFFELKSPGAILPGVLGSICLILSFFALSVLPVNYAGIALIFLAIVFFILEVQVTSYGMLTLGGVVSLVIGSLMLFKDTDPAVRVSLDIILTVALVTALVVGFLMAMVVRAHRKRVTTGVEGLVQQRGVARTALAPRGKVFIVGEIWNAVAEQPVEKGETVEVLSVDGMLLRVRPEQRQPELGQHVVEKGGAA